MTTSNDLDGKAAVSLNVSPASVMDLPPADLIAAALDGDAKAAFRVETMAQLGEIDDATRDRVRAVHKDGPRPDPGMMAEVEAVEILQALNALGVAAGTATKAEHLEAHPELTAWLLQLAKAGARTGYAMLKNLSESGLLESAEQVAFGELPEPAEGETSDAPPIAIIHKPQALPGLPVPSPLVPYINAVVELAGCSVGTAHCVVMGSINLAIANDLDVESLAPDVHPSSLFLMTSARTGWRKSSAFGLAFRAHREADDAVHSRWEEVRREQKTVRASDGAPLPLTPIDRPKEVSPIALRDDSTIEAVMLNLAQGRRTQSLASAEAGSAVGRLVVRQGAGGADPQQAIRPVVRRDRGLRAGYRAGERPSRWREIDRLLTSSTFVCGRTFAE